MTQAFTPTILVIDDSVEDLDALAALLQPSYRVLVARSGEAGLQIAERSPEPDLILLDVLMPGMDGYDVLAHLRQKSSSQSPVIFLTALGEPDDEERGTRGGSRRLRLQTNQASRIACASAQPN